MNPWEKYQEASTQTDSPLNNEQQNENGPWDKYSDSQTSPSDSGFTESSFDTTASPPQQSVNPIQSAGMGMVKGYAESLSGLNTKMLAVSALADSPILDTKALQNSFKKNAEYWKLVAEQSNEMGGDNFVFNMIGGLPIGMAEFGVTRNPISIVAAGGIISALKDYGEEVEKNPDAKIDFGNIGAGAVGGAVTGATLGAVHVTGVALENLAKLIQKHGVDTIKNMFTAINGGDERMGQKALDILSDPTYNKKAKLEDISVSREAGKEKIDAFKGKSKEDITQMRIQRKDELFKRDRDFDFQMNEKSKQLSSDIKLKQYKAEDAINDMKDVRKETLTSLSEANKEQVLQSAANVEGSIANAQIAVKEHIDSVFSGMLQKVEQLKKQTGEAIGTNWSKLIEAHPTEGASSAKIIERIKQADGEEQLFSFKSNNGFILVTPKVDNKAMNQAADQLQSEINSALFTRGSGQSAKVTANTMRITNDLFEQASSMPQGQGTIVPGMGKIYSRLADAFHIKNYADDFSPEARTYVDDIIGLNKKYGGYKERLIEVYGNYFKRDGDSLIPKTDVIFSKFERNDTLFMRKLQEAEKIHGLKDEDKVFDQVKRTYDNFKKVQTAQEQNHLALKSNLQKKISAENAKFEEAIRALRQNRNMLTSEEKRTMNDMLFSMKKANDLENKTFIDSVDKKISEFAKSRAEGLKNLRSSISEEQLTLETKHMLRSFRPKAGMAHIFQSIGIWGVVGGTAGMMTGYMPAAVAVPMVLGKGIMAAATSPRLLANTSRWAIENKAVLKKTVEAARKTGETLNKSAILKRLIATQTTP